MSARSWPDVRGRLHGYNKGLKTMGRPDEVAFWVKCGRKCTPNIEDVGKFGKKWNGWWRELNPTWRVKADGSLSKEEGGSWDNMRAPGANRFLSVIVCLKWWKEAGGAPKKWEEAVADVTWV
ncbi:hypothetical protein B0H11DRAFT_1628864, partial [Mycena galericulata]